MSADIYVNHPQCCDSHSVNVTHNLAPMFRAAGVDWHAYDTNPRFSDLAEPRPASDLLADIDTALNALRADPDRFKAMNPPNGWGSYDVAVRVLEELRGLCRLHPDGTVEVSL